MVSAEVVKLSFYVPYILLVTTGTITFIEALRTPVSYIRHIFNIETCISVVAAFMYGQLMKVVERGPTIDFAAVTRLRYADWFITTPLMLFGLGLVLAYNNGAKIHLSTILLAIVLNFAMLFAGYLGETGALPRKTALAIGFAAYFGLFGLMYLMLVKGSAKADNYVIFGVFAAVWSIYGVVYTMDEATKNVVFNGLDTVAKCFVGIFFWIYFTRVVAL